MTERTRPVLYVIGCGAYPSADLPDLVVWAKERGWDVCVILTPTGRDFADVERLADLTGHPVRSEYKAPGAADVLPWPPQAFVVAPATFNTVNKWVAGISDTLALGLLTEGLGLDEVQMVVVPNPNIAQARHPTFVENLARLRAWGVRVLYDPDQAAQPRSTPGRTSRDLFPWAELRECISDIS